MRIAILGCGNMGQAIISGLIKKYGSDNEIVAYDIRKEALSNIDKKVIIQAPEKWFSENENPDAIVIAIKPQNIAEGLLIYKKIEESTVEDALWISIAAGVSLSKLAEYLPDSAHICRAMPNTPALIGEGISAYSLNNLCNEKDKTLAETVLGACGKVVLVPEKMMNAVTGLSGSGPAYVYLFIEALIEGGITAGLSYDIAAECAVQTVIGAARMIQKTSDTPALLKSRVMSPGGTTARGLFELEKHGFKYSVINAVTAASCKASELEKN